MTGNVIRRQKKTEEDDRSYQQMTGDVDRSLGLMFENSPIRHVGIPYSVGGEWRLNKRKTY